MVEERNYLRVRGEYRVRAVFSKATWELPPRARRIRWEDCHDDPDGGTTSACAENTWRVPLCVVRCWNYLRVRGEYSCRDRIHREYRELPPRARRIRFDTVGDFPQRGTTSACAENTNAGGVRLAVERNYLRVRGEYGVSCLLLISFWELPPRARRILRGGEPEARAHGTTSACAENTPRESVTVSRPGNYLRVRGEYIKPLLPAVLQVELPPRARRIPAPGTDQWRTMGTTSACAENTPTAMAVRAG